MYEAKVVFSGILSDDANVFDVQRDGKQNDISVGRVNAMRGLGIEQLKPL